MDENKDADVVINNIRIRICIMWLSLLDTHIYVFIASIIRYPHMW
jgi:hypothetical protein